MAERMFFRTNTSCKPAYNEEYVEFEWHKGLAPSQKQKSMRSMHKAILDKHPDLKILEVSTKSEVKTGILLSAFNLKLEEDDGKLLSLENIFQSSKVFSKGGPFRDLRDVSPRDAKKDERLKNSGALECFEYCGQPFPLEPKSLFYDWIYIKALRQQPEELLEDLLTYDAFTDIEFNHKEFKHKKKYNCQARSVAIYVSLVRSGKLHLADDMESFKTIYPPAEPVDAAPSSEGAQVKNEQVEMEGLGQ